MKKIFQNVAIDNCSELVTLMTSLLSPGVLVFLDGDPGAGKTYLISQILKQHNISDVTSPTFALHHKYTTPKLIFHHFDLYRVESEDELETVGVWELLGTQACFLIEWGAKFPAGIWPLSNKKVWIKITEGHSDSNSKATRNYEITTE